MPTLLVVASINLLQTPWNSRHGGRLLLAGIADDAHTIANVPTPLSLPHTARKEGRGEGGGSNHHLRCKEEAGKRKRPDLLSLSLSSLLHLSTTETK